MPLYPYRCTSCGHRFEKIQSFSSEPEKVCPNCGKETLVRPLTAPRLQFKGAGWYVNDYAPRSSESTSESPAAESKPAESKETTKPSQTGSNTASAPAASSSESSTPKPSSSES